MVDEEGLASWYREELFEERDSARLVVEAFMTFDKPLGATRLGDGRGLSFDSLSLSLERTMCFGRNLFNPFFDFSSSTNDTWLEDAMFRGNTTLAAVAAALLPINPFRYC